MIRNFFKNIKNHDEDLYKYRYERKFFISEATKEQVEYIVKRHPRFFREIYHERVINNIYFDTLDRDNYVDNIEGATSRTKFRIRWYGELTGLVHTPKLEMKIKEGLLGTKRTFSLNPFVFDTHITRFLLSRTFKDAELPPDVLVKVLHHWPTLVNQYRRKYFQSADKKFRITIDDKQRFYAIRSMGNAFLSKFKDDHNIILELKYDQQYFQEADRVSTKFPFRMTKSSKYARGVYGTTGVQMS